MKKSLLIVVTSLLFVNGIAVAEGEKCNCEPEISALENRVATLEAHSGTGRSMMGSVKEGWQHATSSTKQVAKNAGRRISEGVQKAVQKINCATFLSSSCAVKDGAEVSEAEAAARTAVDALKQCDISQVAECKSYAKEGINNHSQYAAAFNTYLWQLSPEEQDKVNKALA